jgi:hypothetical protein
MQEQQFFKRAKVFRRTGKHSFAVQLEGCPGVVEVHCIEEDWGYMASTWTLAQDLEDRLCAIGTRSMYAWDQKAGRMAVVESKRHLQWDEGVEVALGHYDVARRAFVQCRLRARIPVVEKEKEKKALPQQPLLLPSSLAVAEVGLPPPPTVPETRRRLFKWSSWGM